MAFGLSSSSSFGRFEKTPKTKATAIMRGPIELQAYESCYRGLKNRGFQRAGGYDSSSMAG